MGEPKTAGRRYTRAALLRVLADMLDRAEAIESDNQEPMRITRIAVFGSFLDPEAKDHGDLDVFFEVETKPTHCWKEAVKAAQAAGWHTLYPRTWHLSPRGRVTRRLKARSRIASMHEWWECHTLGCPYLLVWSNGKRVHDFG